MKSIFVSIAASVMAVAAHAAPVTVDFEGYEYGSRSVSYHVGNLKGDTSAGAFSTTLSGVDSFVTYCIELSQSISFGNSPYTNYSMGSASSYAFKNDNAAQDLGRLFASFGTSVNTADESAAFQLAVWEIAYETSSKYNLSTGGAKFTSSKAVQNQANYYLTHLGSASYDLNVMTHSKYQDVIGVIPSPVPEPSTYALMAAGLGAMSFVVRRRRSK